MWVSRVCRCRQLRELQVETIRISHRLMTESTEIESSWNLVKGLVELARSVGLKVHSSLRRGGGLSPSVAGSQLPIPAGKPDRTALSTHLDHQNVDRAQRQRSRLKPLGQLKRSVAVPVNSRIIAAFSPGAIILGISMSIENLRNIAIIAHVDHGKTTLVDKLLSQSGTLDRKDADAERLMDSNDQEKERGITILAKNTAIKWNDYRINIVDTPGHADFGGEVERVLSMVDSVLLLVDAVDGPMPQTRFVTSKAFEQGLRPIVVINKVDRPGARPDWVMDQVFDLFDSLGATDEQLDFPVIYASALNGIAGTDVDNMAEDMTPLYEMIVADVPSPQVDITGPFQMQISALAYDSYVGVIGVGRITRGTLKPGQQVVVKSADDKERKGKVLNVKGYLGLEQVETQLAEAGDIVCINGIDGLGISDTSVRPG